MGAIAGLVYADGRSVSDDESGRLAAAGASRGVDGIARWASGSAGLVRFRQATTPEALGERQPRPSDGSGWAICFDGRLDNRGELLARLGRHGAALRDRPDEEIALALFEAEGDGFLRHLTGDYAFAIWQPDQQRLLCARSPAGFVPFYYVADARRFAFATEPRVLIVGLGVERRINEAAVAELLSQKIATAEDSLWHGIARLPQGAALEYRRGTWRSWQWNDAPYDDWSRVSEADHVARFNHLFDQALIATSRSHTPVVSQLSGGLDSSSVFSRATELQRAGRIDRPITAITARFPGAAADETRWSTLVEQKLGVTADVVGGHTYDPAAAAERAAATLHLPLRPNTLNTVQASFHRLNEAGSRVLLSGEGGDEFLNGSHVHWLDELRRGRVDVIVREAFSQEGRDAGTSLRDVLHNTIAPFFRPRLHDRMRRRRGWTGEPRPDWLNAEWLRGVGLDERVAAAQAPVRLASVAAQNRYAVLEMRGNDPTADAIGAYGGELGVDYRHPFYDRNLIRFYLGASGGVLFARGERRHLLREAMRGTLPEAIRTRRTKAIFNGQTLDGLAILLKTRPFAEMLPAKLGWVDVGRLEAIWAAFSRWHEDGESGAMPDLPFGALWGTAALDLWLTHAARM